MLDLAVPTSIGELIDKVTILLIKAEKIQDAGKQKNIKNELTLLENLSRSVLSQVQVGIESQIADLQSVNRKLWEVEDDLREHERRNDFGQEFVVLARSVYQLNDERSRIKKEMNIMLGSQLVEEKSYT